MNIFHHRRLLLSVICSLLILFVVGASFSRVPVQSEIEQRVPAQQRSLGVPFSSTSDYNQKSNQVRVRNDILSSDALLSRRNTTNLWLAPDIASNFKVSLVNKHTQLSKDAQNFTEDIVTGLISYYSFEDGTATDNSGNGYHGTLLGTALVVNGALGKALKFNEQDTAVKTLVNVDQSSSSPGVTLAAWVYPTSVSRGRHHVISSDNGGFDWSMLRDGDTWYVFTGEGSRSTGFKVDLDQWQHLVVVFTPSTGIKFYKNVQVVTIPHINFDVSDNNIGIGHNPGYGEYFGGAIDEVRLYNRSLSESEVQELYQQGYSISGQIKDANGNPIAGVQLSSNSGKDTVTDANGFYNITRLIAGTHTVTPMKLGYIFSPATRDLAVPPNAVEQNFTGAAFPVTNMRGAFYNFAGQSGGTVATDLVLQPTAVTGYVNFTELPADYRPLCGAGYFNGTHEDANLLFSFTSQDGDADCGFDHNAIYTMAAHINENQTHLWGRYEAKNANGSSLVESPGVFEVWTAGQQPQRRIYTGNFTNTTYNLGGTVTMEIAVGTNTVSGYTNFDGYPGGAVLCGAGEFTGVITGTMLEYSFVTIDSDPGCTSTSQLMANENSRFLVKGNFSQNGVSLEGNYVTSYNQRGIFKIADSSTYAIVGSVLDPANQPLANVLITNSTGQVVQTDANGNYVFSNLTAGTYTLSPSKSSYSFSPNAQTVVVPPNTSGINFIGTPPQPCLLPNFGDTNGDPLRQKDSRWINIPYGGTYYPTANGPKFLPFIWEGIGKDTIGRWGCYLTSAAMIVNYFAQSQGKSFRTNPVALNQWLQEHKGYASGEPLPSKDNPEYVNTAFVIPTQVAKYARDNGIQLAWERTERIKTKDNIPLESPVQFVARTRTLLDTSMCALNPVILEVSGPYGTHFVAGTGKAQSGGIETWRIHDPERTSTSTLQEVYENKYKQIVMFSSDAPKSALLLAIHSPVEVVITDPLGRRTGFDPRTNSSYAEIPTSSYGIEFLAAADESGGLLEQTVLDLLTPVDGQYTIQTIGTDSGSYSIEVIAVNTEGNSTKTLFTGTTSLNHIDNHNFVYTSWPRVVYLPMIMR